MRAKHFFFLPPWYDNVCTFAKMLVDVSLAGKIKRERELARAK